MSTEENLPNGWVWTTLEEVCSIERGITFPSAVKSFASMIDNIACLRTANVQEHVTWDNLIYIPKTYLKDVDKLIIPGDILISMANSRELVGKVSFVDYVPTESTFGAFISVIRTFGEISRKFLFYYFRLSDTSYKLKGTSSQTVNIANISLDSIYSLNFPFPPLPEQSRIVAAIEQQFTRLDSAVASLRSAKARAKQYRASLLKSAVEGELTKEWRTTHPVSETGAQLLQRILAERRKRWEEAEMAKMREKGITPKDDKWKEGYKEPQKPDVEHLPKLSEGWCWATLDELSGHITSGSRGWAQYYTTSGSLFVRVGNFNRLTTKIDLQNAVFVKAPNSIEADRCRLQIDDLLITITADVGMVGVVDESVLQWGEAYINQHVGLVRLLHSKLTAFIALALASEVMQTQIRGKQYGATKTGLGLEDVKSLPVPLAPLSEQQYICTELERYLSIIQEQDLVIEASLKRAGHERQSILREAFAGRLVPQAPNDEPASVLLERIRAERKRREEAEQAIKASRKADHMEIIRRRHTNKGADGQQHAGLYEKLIEAGQPLPPDDLFKQVGLKTDEQPESVEVFYEELRSSVEDKLIVETRSNDAYVLLEALEPSDEILASLDEERITGKDEAMVKIPENFEQLEEQQLRNISTLWDTDS